MILALGGNGFIGHSFAERFSKTERIRIFGQGYRSDNQRENIEFIEGDYRYANFDTLLENIDTVFHFISSTVPFDGTDMAMETVRDDIIPTIRLLDSMKRRNVRRIFFISSGGTIYGECEAPAKETDRVSPNCVYAVQKSVIENYLQLYESYDGIQAYILRVANPYGLEINRKRKQGIIPIFTQKILHGEFIEIWGNGKNKRDYIYIDEVIDAIEKVYRYKGKYRIFNIGTGKSYSIEEIIRLIESETKIQARIKYKNRRKCDLMNSVLDVSLIHQECGWKSKLTIEQGIKTFLENMRSGTEINI